MGTYCSPESWLDACGERFDGLGAPAVDGPEVDDDDDDDVDDCRSVRRVLTSQLSSLSPSVSLSSSSSLSLSLESSRREGGSRESDGGTKGSARCNRRGGGHVIAYPSRGLMMMMMMMMMISMAPAALCAF